MIDIPKIYNEYLQRKNKENRIKYEKYKGWFSASSAGSCYRKQLHRKQDLKLAMVYVFIYASDQSRVHNFVHFTQFLQTFVHLHAILARMLCICMFFCKKQIVHLHTIFAIILCFFRFRNSPLFRFF